MAPEAHPLATVLDNAARNGSEALFL